MNLFKFAILIIAIYLISLFVSYFVKLHVPFLLLSLALFSVIFVIFIIILAIIMAIQKKPKIEEGNYRIERIKGKEEF